MCDTRVHLKASVSWRSLVTAVAAAAAGGVSLDRLSLTDAQQLEEAARRIRVRLQYRGHLPRERD